MKSPRPIIRCLVALGALVVCLCASSASFSQSFHYESRPRVEMTPLAYSAADPAPTMMEPAEEIGHPLPRRRYLDPRYRGRAAELTDLESRRWASRAAESRVRSRSIQSESIANPQASDPFIPVQPESGPMISAPDDPVTSSEQRYFDGPPTDAPWVDAPVGEGEWIEGSNDGYESHGGDCGGCGQCDDCCGRNRLFPCLRDWWRAPTGAGGLGRNLSGIAAAQAFKSPVDLGLNGNFGLYYGGNWGFPFLRAAGIGGQFGALVAFSDFQGSSGLVNHARTQWFVTGGLFHRAPCNQGLQGGAVLDYLNDEFYVTMNLLQIRAEIAYLWQPHEVGFWAAAHTKSDTAVVPAAFGVPSVTWQANDQYNLYYRYHYGNGGVSRMWIGLTGHGDVLFGGDTTAPLSEQWAVQVAYNYMIPRNDPTIPNAIQETWGLTIGTIWYPRCKTPNCKFDAYRPLFTAADNSSFFVRTK